MATLADWCSVEECENVRTVRGLCVKHYARWRRHGDVAADKRKVTPDSCVVRGCDRPYLATGYCSLHYQRVNRARGRDRYLKCRYGINGADYDRMLAEQDGGCAICGAPPPEKKSLAVDHDHKTGQVRGLLCDDCNVGLGKLCDDPQRLRVALAYLEVTRGDPC